MWTIFVLDFDSTYDAEKDYDLGVQPLAYLVLKDKIKDIYQYAEKAHNDFHSDKSTDLCIGDYFEELMTCNNVDFRRIGVLDMTFGERRGNYLDENIPIRFV